MNPTQSFSLRLATRAALAVIWLALLAPGARAAPSTVISAPFATAGVGDTIKVSISVAHAADLAFFQFDLAFDPLIVQADAGGGLAGSGLPADWFLTSPGAVDNAAGLILGVSANGSAFSDAAEIVDLYFTALQAGISPLTFSSVFLNLLDSGFDTFDGRITVTGPRTLPEPAAPALLALAGVLWLRKRHSPTRPPTPAQAPSRAPSPQENSL